MLPSLLSKPVAIEHVSPEGLRLDGRHPIEMRQLRTDFETVSKADGSVVFEMDNTKVIAAIYDPKEDGLQMFDEMPDRSHH